MFEYSYTAVVIIRRVFLVAALLLAWVNFSSTSAQERNIRRCILEVKGKIFIDGPCRFSPSENGGYAISSRNKWFAIVNVFGDGEVKGSWNNDEGYPASHAHDDLGTLSKNGACFVGSIARVCAYN